MMHNFRVFCALLRRDFKVLKKSLIQSLINGLIIATIELTILIVFFPRMGMPVQLGAPIFLGTLVFMLFNLGFPFAFEMAYNIKFSRFIDYHMTLPISKRWLFAAYIINFMIQVLITTLPIIILGIICLGNLITFENIQWLYFLTVHLLGILFFSVFFYMCSFQFSFEWFSENIWSRLLGPLLTLGSVFYIWHRVYAVSKTIAYLFLLNPVTYIAEGLRATLIGGSQYLPPQFCIGAIIISTLLFMILLSDGIKKRLDPV